MKLIAHRGNFNGSSPYENDPQYISDAISSGYDVEIDVWWDGRFFLGHDKPVYEIQLEFLLSEGLWIHAKNIDALAILSNIDTLNCFYHDKDEAVLTSQGYIWVFPNKPISKLSKKSVAMIKDKNKYNDETLSYCAGVCSDNVQNFKRFL